eukprot:CAMPEP_0194300036 /NCGR_PEP_ID=MMETSP0169-20130528/61036_1 /TAXON_ID=218684 /ORGANISM="Corethron pennatum, Strain L29A3" /LENGTH=636 /DNA_ID=CAMNT_0039050171 /DNA_START=1733 /DNA_END=3643 /DNA_ORIENTATION=+
MNSSTEDERLLSSYLPSIVRHFHSLHKEFLPYISGDPSGFEYLGCDFVLSHPILTEDGVLEYPSYLLEVNAPPSQDTATGLAIAEEVHDAVLCDLIHLTVMPRVTGTEPRLGGWIPCLSLDGKGATTDATPLMRTKTVEIPPSKAAILNRIRWAIYERRRRRESEMELERLMKGADGGNEAPHDGDDLTVDLSLQEFSNFARTQYAFFNDHCGLEGTQPTIFLENAGGTQVPKQVAACVMMGLERYSGRVGGGVWVRRAQDTVRRLLGATDEHVVTLGPNASSLLILLAEKFRQIVSPGDEIVIAGWNHDAHRLPWERLAVNTGARAVYWKLTGRDPVESLPALLSSRTRVVAVGHCSNVLGHAHDLGAIVKAVRVVAPSARIVVDGVAAAPHLFADVAAACVDWYVMAGHKTFGPHSGAIVGSAEASLELNGRLRETGTANYEACAGLYGTGLYLATLAGHKEITGEGQGTAQDGEARGPVAPPAFDGGGTEGDMDHFFPGVVEEAYRRIRNVEGALVAPLLEYFRGHPRVQVLEEGPWAPVEHRLPIVSAVHRDISADDVVAHCAGSGIICRSGTFLSSQIFKSEYVRSACLGADKEILKEKGAVRFSFAHYNTPEEVRSLILCLKKLKGWGMI